MSSLEKWVAKNCRFASSSPELSGLFKVAFKNGVGAISAVQVVKLVVASVGGLTPEMESSLSSAILNDPVLKSKIKQKESLSLWDAQESYVRIMNELKRQGIQAPPPTDLRVKTLLENVLQEISGFGVPVESKQVSKMNQDIENFLQNWPAKK